MLNFSDTNTKYHTVAMFETFTHGNISWETRNVYDLPHTTLHIPSQIPIPHSYHNISHFMESSP